VYPSIVHQVCSDPFPAWSSGQEKSQKWFTGAVPLGSSWVDFLLPLPDTAALVGLVNK
jgi:hypothetical protein